MSEDNVLSETHHVAAQKMAEFWAALLQADTAKTLIKGWLREESKAEPSHQVEGPSKYLDEVVATFSSKFNAQHELAIAENGRQGGFDDFGVEFMQASAAVQRSRIYTDEEVAAFKQALEKRILASFIEPEFGGRLFFHIENDYYPAAILSQAGRDAGIPIRITTFPFKTSTIFDIYSEKLTIQQGNATHRIRLNPDCPVKHAYFVYKTEPDGPLKTLALDEDDPVRDCREKVDRMISEKEGRRTFTIHFVGPFFTATPEEAIDACGYVREYQYRLPQDVANDWALRAETEDAINFFIKERGANVSECLEILKDRERNTACLSPISPINSLKEHLNSLKPRI